MKYLVTLGLLLTFSCGHSTIEVEDSQQTVVIDWNFQQFEDIYRAGCEEQFTYEDEIQDCIDAQINDFLNVVNGEIEGVN